MTPFALAVTGCPASHGGVSDHYRGPTSRLTNNQLPAVLADANIHDRTTSRLVFITKSHG